MTERELRKLDRHDLLELLVEQTKEASRLRLVLEERETERVQTVASLERLKNKLGEKDEQLERLKGRLDEKDAQDKKLKQKLDRKDEELAGWQEAHKAQIERFKDKLNQKDADMERMNMRVRFLEDKNMELEAEIKQYKQDLARLSGESGSSDGSAAAPCNVTEE